ncbi:hypothetical protein [Sphingobium ummariense]
MIARGTILGLGALALLPAGTPAMAQDIRVDRQMFVERVHADANGRPRRILASAARVAPGDRVVVLLHWRNEGLRPVRGFALTQPVPRGSLPDLRDPAMLLSVDGGAHWGRLDQLWLPTPLGGVRRALPEDVTHVRWALADEIPAGATGRISYRATIR